MVYPINEAIERLMESFIDEETGEITATEDEMNEAIEKLQMEFDDKIVELRNQYINLTAEAEAIKAEKMKLEKRQKQAEKSADRMKRWLAYLLKGEKFQKDACKISYRKSEEAVVDDRESFVAWADANNRELLKYSDPIPRRDVIKKFIKEGNEISFAHIETKNNVQIK